MMTTNLTISVPFAKRHLLTEIRIHGGKFNADNKTWNLEDTPETRNLKELVERRVAVPSPAERISNIAKLTVDLLNGLKYRDFRIEESGNRIVIVSEPIVTENKVPVVTTTSAQVENTSLVTN